MTDDRPMRFLVGAFNANVIYTLEFVPASGNLTIARQDPAVGAHSWLTFSPGKRNVYATVWSEPTAVAAYSVLPDGELHPLNTLPVRKRSGYVCASSTHLYSVGGPFGDVFTLDKETGAIDEHVQKFSVVSEEQQRAQDSKTGTVLHGDFGGVRHGTHSCDLSVDGRCLYIADIGRNCIWICKVRDDVDPILEDGRKPLSLISRTPAPNEDDGPRHTWPHPNGTRLYCLQEHSSTVDTYEIVAGGLRLEHMEPRVKCIPADKDPKRYWADEVRTSTVGPSGESPRYLYVSTRGLEPGTPGYVAVFPLDWQGDVTKAQAIDIFETPTSGGWSNAVEPAPRFAGDNGKEYMALTDSEEGWVFVLSFDGFKIKQEARVNLSQQAGKLVGAATAIWY